jgi:ATP-binding protein involved in chromosome partitioning
MSFLKNFRKNDNENKQGAKDGQPLSNNDTVLEKLSKIPIPGSKENIVSAGMLKEATATGSDVFIRLQFNADIARHRRMIEAQVRNGMRAIGFENVNLKVDGLPESSTQIPLAQSPPPRPQPQPQQAEKLVPEVRNIIAVASGKGGVGKSTVAVNLVCALAKLGKKVGILDADVYGPNIPMMFGLEGKRPEVVRSKVMPLERSHIKIMSLGFLAPKDEAIIWRGPLVGRAIEQMLRDVEWGELDFLILDMPPGTGDAQLTISQRLELAGAILVSTPQPVALSDALKGLKMFQKVNVPILGLIENMSAFICDNCEKEHDIFGKGGVKKAAGHEKATFLGDIPITLELRTGGDEGKPVVLEYPDSIAAKKFLEIAEKIVQKIGDEQAPAPKHFKL